MRWWWGVVVGLGDGGGEGWRGGTSSPCPINNWGEVVVGRGGWWWGEVVVVGRGDIIAMSCPTNDWSEVVVGWGGEGC